MVRKHHRNFLPTFIINLIFWLILGGIVLLLSPEQNFQLQILKFKLTLPETIILFFIFFTLALGLTLALLFGHTRRGFFLTLFFDSWLLFRLLKQASLINILLLTAIYLTFESYFSFRNKDKS